MTSVPKENKPAVSFVEITTNNAGQRIDNFLLSAMKGVPKSHIYRLLRSGQVRVNKGRKKPSYKLAEGDSVRLPPVRVSDSKQIRVPDSVINELLAAKLYEDDNLLIINKPSGIPVHSGSGYQYGVIEALKQANEDQFIELAHRLDRETSGCLILVKNRQTLTRINALLSDDKSTDIQKHYSALVLGKWPDHLTTINQPLLKKVRSGEHMVEVDEDGAHAISHFYCEQTFSKNDSKNNLSASLMNIKIETGRTHQIRVHASHNGHPLAGDTKYGDERFNKAMKKLGLNRLFLHARKVDIQLDTLITVEAPLSTELEAVLDRIN